MQTGALLLVLVVAGCGGPGTDNADASGVNRATVGQYASPVNDNRVRLDETFTELSQACLWSAPGHVATDPRLPLCEHGPVTAARQAARLATTLTVASRQDATGYVGEPPAQIQDLITHTRARARALRNADAELARSSCVKTRMPGCRHKLRSFAAAMTKLRNQLGAWSTYL